MRAATIASRVVHRRRSRRRPKVEQWGLSWRCALRIQNRHSHGWIIRGRASARLLLRKGSLLLLAACCSLPRTRWIRSPNKREAPPVSAGQWIILFGRTFSFRFSCAHRRGKRPEESWKRKRKSDATVATVSLPLSSTSSTSSTHSAHRSKILSPMRRRSSRWSRCIARQFHLGSETTEPSGSIPLPCLPYAPHHASYGEKFLARHGPDYTNRGVEQRRRTFDRFYLVGMIFWSGIWTGAFERHLCHRDLRFCNSGQIVRGFERRLKTPRGIYVRCLEELWVFYGNIGSCRHPLFVGNEIHGCMIILDISKVNLEQSSRRTVNF